MNIFPADPNSRDTEAYRALVTIAKKYFNKGKYDDFATFFLEEKYLISLWTDHLIFQFGQLNDTLKGTCLKVIEEHTENPLAPIVAKQERAWLDNYLRMK